MYYITSLGSICVFEHMFDKNFEYNGSKEYKDIIKTDFTLIRNTVLNGGKPKIPDVITTLSNKEKFLTNIHLSSNKKWICQDDMHFVIHNFYGSKKYELDDEMKIDLNKMFLNYKNIDIFMYYSYEFINNQQLIMILNACRLYNKNAKLLVFSNLPDVNIDNDIININISAEIVYLENTIKDECSVFESSWNIPNVVIKKLNNIFFDINLFKKQII